MSNSPSVRLFASAAPTQRVTDADGRCLLLRRMNALDKLRMFKAAGPTLSQNQNWLGMAMLACSVTAIDEVPVPAPSTEAQIEALVARLGDSGIAAIAQALDPEAPADPDTAGN